MRRGDKVELVDARQELRAGDAGVVLGFYRPAGGERVVVKFGPGDVRAVLETELALVEAAEPARLSGG